MISALNLTAKLNWNASIAIAVVVSNLYGAVL